VSRAVALDRPPLWMTERIRVLEAEVAALREERRKSERRDSRPLPHARDERSGTDRRVTKP